MDSVQCHFYAINSKQVRTDHWDTGWRTLPNVLLERPQQGQWRCQWDGGELTVPGGHLLVVPVACRHRLIKQPGPAMYSDWSYISWQVAGVQDVRTHEAPHVFDATFATSVASCFAEQRNVVLAVEAQSAALRILAAYLKEKPAGDPLMDGRIQRVIRYMRDHLHQDINREDLATVCHLSPTRFHDVFVEATGVAPMRYFLRLRLQRAQQLLRGTEYAIGMIAEYCGFQSQAYFNRVFKQAFGRPPGSVRKQR